MASIPVLSFDEVDPLMTWPLVTQAIHDGHLIPKADVADSFCRRNTDTLLTRSAWIDGLGVVVKAATVLPNANPSINGGVMMFDDQTGALSAVIDFHLVTKWKTIGDSLLAASMLARANSETLLILGAGTVASNLIEAYRSLFPNIKITLWNRTIAKAETLAQKNGCDVADNLADAVAKADIISSATMTTTPILQGEWISAGTHVDLIGAYRPDMREADDELLKQSSLFVDSRATTIEHIGELKNPIERGVFTADHIKADYYDIPSGTFKRNTDDERTVFKNGGGAHMDLMVSDAILRLWKGQ
jgi:ornithine cyclodeaminase